MPELLFYPDKPVTSSPNRIADWDASGNFILQEKIDGWRVVVQFLSDRKIAVISRHNKDYTTDVLKDKHVAEQLQSLSLILPPNTHLDAEWLSRRACSKKYELPARIFLLDMLVCEGRALRNISYSLRLASLESLLNSWTKRSLAKATDEDDASPGGYPVSMIDSALPGKFEEFYEMQKKIPWSEGVVAKHKDSTLCAGLRGSIDNPRWYKVRYRGGVDGNVNLDALRS